MNRKLKSAWVKALRSGKYRQGRMTLYHQSSREYCCLGVLCRVFGARFRDGQFYYEGRSNDTFLPDTLADEIGLNGDTQRELARMNDRGGDFDSIADHIQKTL